MLCSCIVPLCSFPPQVAPVSRLPARAILRRRGRVSTARPCLRRRGRVLISTRTPHAPRSCIRVDLICPPSLALPANAILLDLKVGHRTDAGPAVAGPAPPSSPPPPQPQSLPPPLPPPRQSTRTRRTGARLPSAPAALAVPLPVPPGPGQRRRSRCGLSGCGQLEAAHGGADQRRRRSAGNPGLGPPAPLAPWL